MKIYFSYLAQKELQEAVSYYDEINSVLGDELIYEVQEAQRLMLLFPLAWSKIGRDQRKYLLRKFPYMIIYKVYADRIVVAAFAHRHRKPDYYIGRV